MTLPPHETKLGASLRSELSEDEAAVLSWEFRPVPVKSGAPLIDPADLGHLRDNRLVIEIRWHRSLGRPTSARMADSFFVSLDQKIERNKGNADGGPAVEIKLPGAVRDVALTDLADDGDYHRVGGVVLNLEERTVGGEYIVCVVTAQLAPEISWTTLPDTRRQITPPGRKFRKNGYTRIAFDVLA